MMRYLLLALIAFTSTSLFAQKQPDTVQWSPDAMRNNGWPLPNEISRPTQFIAFLDVKLHKERIHKTLHLYYIANPKWIRNESFVADSVKDRYLPLAQLFFDCYELESRKLQERLNTSEALMDVEIPESNIRLNDQIDGLREITNNGIDSMEMRFWRHWMDSALLATPRPFLPNFESGKWEFGFDIGGGVSMLNGDLSNYFQTLPAFGYAASLGIKRVQFDYSALHSFAKSDLAFVIGDFKFTDSNRLQLNQTSWTIGYQFLKHYKWTITPYGGLSTFRIINRDEPEGSLYAKGRTSVNWEAGVITEWRFLHFYQGNNAQFFWKLRLKVGYAPIYYLYKVRGDAVKIQVGIGFTMKSVRNLPRE